MSYDIEEHRHRFAAWAASRAASVKGCRFSVEQGRAILDKALRHVAADPIELPAPAELDVTHRKWRKKVIEQAEKLHLPFTHGIAAKLINVYLKSIYVCEGHHNHECVRCLHPPIDGILLKALSEKEIGDDKATACWNKMRVIRWSKFDSAECQEVIDNIRIVSKGNLWKIEEYWRGYQ